jgi:CheY-like chemotaxis protein
MHSHPTPPTPAPTAPIIQPGRRVMFVDDEPALLAVGRAILSTLGVEVITAESGEQAIELLAAAKASDTLPSVVLLDLTMPGGLSGLDTLDQLLRLQPDLPVIACSGFFGEGADELCKRLGFCGMLPKPYTPESLITIVRRICLRSAE